MRSAAWARFWLRVDWRRESEGVESWEVRSEGVTMLV